MTSQVAIYNKALSLAGSRSRVSIPSEKSREAELCTLWYDPTRQTILRSAPWPSAKALQQLSLTSQASDISDWVAGNPQLPWQYAYAYPSDCLQPRFLQTYENFDVGAIGSQKVIFCDAYNPVLVYTKDEQNPEMWDVMLENCIVNGLSAYISMDLNGRPKTAEMRLQMANGLIAQARVQAANESNMPMESVPDWLATRGVMVGETFSGYVYPSGPLLIGNW